MRPLPLTFPQGEAPPSRYPLLATGGALLVLGAGLAALGCERRGAIGASRTLLPRDAA